MALRLPHRFLSNDFDIRDDSPEKARNAGNAQKFGAFAGVKVVL